MHIQLKVAVTLLHLKNWFSAPAHIVIEIRSFFLAFIHNLVDCFRVAFIVEAAKLLVESTVGFEFAADRVLESAARLLLDIKLMDTV